MSKGFSHNVTEAIHAAAVATTVPEALLRAVCWVESSGNPMAVGPELANGQTAKGLLQLLDPTALSFGVKDSFDPKQNALAGAMYIRQLIAKFGNTEDALAAYNWGPGHVKRALKDGATYPTQVLRYVQRVKDRWALEDQGQNATELPAPPAPTRIAQCTSSCPVHCIEHNDGGKA